MSAHEDYHRQPDHKQISDRGFGLLFAGVFAVIGAYPLVHKHPPRLWAFGASLAFLALAAAAPSALHFLNAAWTRLGLLLNRIMTPVMMSALFYLVITPAGFLIRKLRGDILAMRADPHAQTYWTERTPPGPAPESMSRQF